MKKMLIGALVAVNIALVLALALGEGNSAQAQSQRISNPEYMAVPSKVAPNVDAIFVVDLSKRKIIAFEYDYASKRMNRYRSRDLKRDFGVNQ
jgi:hypothetical protein